ncbi:MAG: LytR family transcriptional regulator [Anaerolineae bacterium]|nr:MAG: LytR family transcriptional regulator [Anaerolineae bacterium]
MNNPRKASTSGLLNSGAFWLIAVFSLAALVLCWTGYQAGRLFSGSEGNLVDRFFGTPVPPSDATGFLNPTEDPFSLSFSPPTPPPWNGTDRVTMLIMGLDYRDWEAQQPAYRSDTMILLTVDPVARTAGILSIPRDLWANIPGFKPQKINAAYYFGDLYKVPGGGPALAMATVEATLGVPIDYYAVIDFNSFVRFIDLIGGVKLDIAEPIKIDPIGDKPPRTLKAGRQVLPGELALAYARTRSTPGGDFDRAARQQQVIFAIRDRLLEPANFQRIFQNASSIYAELKSGIRTNLPFEDALMLAVLATQVPRESIQQAVINEKYVTFGTSPDGLAILIPVPDRIRTLRDQIFSTGGAFSPLTPGNPQERMQLEFASISVQDGASEGSLGQNTAQYLLGLGANVTAVGQAEHSYSQTTIIDHTGNPYAVQFLVTLFGIQENQIIQQFDPNSPVDIEIKLGSDWLNDNSLP